ncbi:hypothetical protein RHSIM_Rhsim12G0175300 [Rhododendron simsii]|uniref:NAC domain-containing protein n=1 Tax=Rhododendron simsii TaxID=118357 RepID=A0A834L887_RHOSS|nr:hypothetical protein RHSIM_Rhsim12G0175300 [Rhododendron simsii]
MKGGSATIVFMSVCIGMWMTIALATEEPKSLPLSRSPPATLKPPLAPSPVPADHKPPPTVPPVPARQNPPSTAYLHLMECEKLTGDAAECIREYWVRDFNKEYCCSIFQQVIQCPGGRSTVLIEFTGASVGPKTERMDLDYFLMHQLNNKFTNQPVLIDRLIIANLSNHNPQDFFPGDWHGTKECYVLTPRRYLYGLVFRPDHRPGNGYWKGTTPGNVIFGKDGLGGVKKNLCFYEGENTPFLRNDLEFYLHKSKLESRTASAGKSSSLLRTTSELPTEKLNKSIVLMLDVKYFLLHISQVVEQRELRKESDGNGLNAIVTGLFKSSILFS